MPPDPSRERISKSPSLVPLMSRKCTFGADCKKLERASLSEESRDSTSPRSEWSLEQALSRNAGRCSGASSKASWSTAFTCCQRSGVMFSPCYSSRDPAKPVRWPTLALRWRARCPRYSRSQQLKGHRKTAVPQSGSAVRRGEKVRSRHDPAPEDLGLCRQEATQLRPESVSSHHRAWPCGGAAQSPPGFAD